MDARNLRQLAEFERSVGCGWRASQCEPVGTTGSLRACELGPSLLARSVKAKTHVETVEKAEKFGNTTVGAFQV